MQDAPDSIDTQGKQVQSLFYVYHQGEQKGPISISEIASRIRKQELEMNDYMYDEESSDWTVLVGHPALSELIKDVQVAAPMQSQPASGGTETEADEWFALKGTLRFGPFAYTELIRLLQEKSMHDSDFVWRAGLKDWQKVADLPEFSGDAVRKLRETGSAKLDEVFFRRRHARVEHDSSIIMHNNQKVFRGRSLEVSAGGAGVVLDTHALEVGHQVFLHFKPAKDLPPFHAVCEVVSRRPTHPGDSLAPMHYGVKFLKIEKSVVKKIELIASARKVA